VLPPGFSPSAEPSGKALLSVRATVCEELALDGMQPAATILGEIALRIEPPDGQGSTHDYLLAQAASDREIASALRRYGVPSVFQWMTFDERQSLGDRLIMAAAPWMAPMWSISARIAEPVAKASTSDSVSWSIGARGSIRTNAIWKHSAAALAVGQLVTTPQSRLASVAGGDAVAASGHYVRFDARGSFEVQGAESEQRQGVDRASGAADQPQGGEGEEKCAAAEASAGRGDLLEVGVVEEP
jgi:hypothetical protein